MKYAAQRLANRVGYKITRLYGPDVTPELRATIKSARRYTATQDDAIVALHDAVHYIVRADIPGAFVECGVWKGGSLLVIARELQKLGIRDRDLVGFDTFAGMTAPTEEDVRYDGKPGRDPSSIHLPVAPSPEDVRALIHASGYPSDRIQLVSGRVEDTLPQAAPEAIALLRLDTDWYESTRHEFTHLYPRLASGGILIVDDYGQWRGAQKATDEYLASLERPPFLVRVDHSVRIAVKP